MYSTPDRTLVATFGLCLMLTAAGCQLANQPQPPAAVNTAPLLVDAAMQKRDWAPLTATYANGAVYAWPTYLAFESKTGLPSWQYPLIEPPLFLLNVAATPVMLFTQPPGTNQVHGSTRHEPTYTAQPQLP